MRAWIVEFISAKDREEILARARTALASYRSNIEIATETNYTASSPLTDLQLRRNKVLRMIGHSQSILKATEHLVRGNPCEIRKIVIAA